MLHRHDISDRAWKILEPLLLGRRGTKSRPAKDKRYFGEIYQNMEIIGTILIGVLPVGEINAYGQKFLKL